MRAAAERTMSDPEHASKAAGTARSAVCQRHALVAHGVQILSAGLRRKDPEATPTSRAPAPAAAWHRFRGGLARTMDSPAPGASLGTDDGNPSRAAPDATARCRAAFREAARASASADGLGAAAAATALAGISSRAAAGAGGRASLDIEPVEYVSRRQLCPTGWRQRRRRRLAAGLGEPRGQDTGRPDRAWCAGMRVVLAVLAALAAVASAAASTGLRGERLGRRSVAHRAIAGPRCCVPRSWAAPCPPCERQSALASRGLRFGWLGEL